MVHRIEAGGSMATVQPEAQLRSEAETRATSCVQAGAFLLELSLDWIVLRASENVHHMLGKSHALLINEPLGDFVHSDALHDLRNLFSRLSGTTGIARAYRIRLTDEPDLFDVAFQQSDGRVLLEAVPSPTGGFGESFGTVAGLAAGLAGASGQELLDGGARRMRALTGFDRVSLLFGDKRCESSRGPFAAPADLSADLPALLGDSETAGVPVFPRMEEDTSVDAGLTRCPPERELRQLREQGIRASIRVPFSVGGETGEFRCDSRRIRPISFELHAAAELFAHLFALRVEIDRLRAPAKAGAQS